MVEVWVKPRRQLLKSAGFGVAALTLGAFLGSRAARAEDPIGHVVAYLGRAGLGRSDGGGSGGGRGIETNMAIRAGDTLSTGERSLATIRFEGGVVITVDAMTDMEIVANDPSTSGWRPLIRVRSGIVRIEFAPGAEVDHVTVETSTAHVITQYAHAVVEATPLLTSVFADRGRVLVSGVEGPGGAVTVLGPGKGVDVIRVQSAYDPLPWTPARINLLMQRTTYP